jgi:AraC-like DNA-binding protein
MNSHNLSNHIVSNRLCRTVRSYLTPTHMNNVSSELSYRNLLNLIDKGAVPADIALRSGTEFVIGDYGVLGFAMKSAATLAQAVQLAAKYHQATSPLLSVRFRHEPPNFLIVLENRFRLPENAFRLVAEELIASFPAVLLDLTGRSVDPTFIELTFANADCNSSCYEIFGCEPRFNQKETLVSLPLEALQWPLLAADLSNLLLLEQRCQELLALISRADSLRSKITALLLQQLAVTNTSKAAAFALQMSERTLRRRLAEEHVSFQELLTDVRQRLAKDYLSCTNLSAQEIAELLGFTEASNFRRAFKAWSGTTPDQFRMTFNKETSAA